MAITINGDGLIDIGGTTSTQGRVRLAEDVDNGTNYVELTAPASVASNRVITFPDATTTVVGTDATQTLTNKTLTSPTITGGTVSSATVTSSTLTSPTIGGTPVVNGSLIVLGTSQFATGTVIDFTGIPSWVKRVTVMFQGVSTNGTGSVQVQLGTSGGFVTTGYVGSGSRIVSTVGTSTYTTGFTDNNQDAGAVRHGSCSITNISGNSWVCSMVLGRSDVGATTTYGGSVNLSGTLDRLRIIGSATGSPSDTFDAGTINIQYE